ncbi:ABC transporter ATP-binding protein [Serpentinicella alkaliphila]|uniref:Putative ABC transport system ATP-binding protein n=1 Tax=Serpentinicella alkaliphila TaxID=1734049 RepID=A0A4R2UA28_9FIRM|nr:ABC transporter ATP-binding protein [Serpentinicella alkaliphila]QUH25230.1 ABC transporter ATP-binding protein [Serpentinicella alkaliphila]TCQ07039.1 putative ABC transport system ATP-binding protein [Serpentinicella alkaliphila]
MIKVDKIRKLFKKTLVLHDISFEITSGDFVAIMGPSGSGKSTLLYSISGMDSISSGSVLFEGINISEMQEDEISRFRLSKMGIVFQNPHMLRNLSIFDNIILPGLVAKKESPDNIRKRAAELMKRMDIHEIVDRDINEVSGGQLQRASICRAMINNPEILFLDEPTGALNSSATDQVLKILEDLNDEGITIMTVTHDPRVAARAKKVLYIRDGQIAASKEFVEGADRLKELDRWLNELLLGGDKFVLNE